jgi:triosephosphate isomerase
LQAIAAAGILARPRLARKQEILMRKMMVAGNWKMNGTEATIRSLLADILDGLEPAAPGGGQPVDIAVFPPFPYLPLVQSLLAGTTLQWGGQNLNPHASGAHTGEVSASMLREFGCSLVLTGHSERRALYGESDAAVGARFCVALEAGLTPVLCVGETIEQRDAGTTEAVVGRQLDAVLNQAGIEGFKAAMVAYEPVWAIGTGHTATPDQAQAVHAFIRDKIASLDGTIGDSIQILYGGSVNGSNAADLFARTDIDGGLVGGASLKAGEFLAICRSATLRD